MFLVSIRFTDGNGVSLPRCVAAEGSLAVAKRRAEAIQGEKDFPADVDSLTIEEIQPGTGEGPKHVASYYPDGAEMPWTWLD